MELDKNLNTTGLKKKRTQDDTNIPESKWKFRILNKILKILNDFIDLVPVGPPAKRPNKDPMPSHRPSPEQYAAMMAAAAAAGQPFPIQHVCYTSKKK